MNEYQFPRTDPLAYLPDYEREWKIERDVHPLAAL